MVTPGAIMGTHELYREWESLTDPGSRDQKGVKVPAGAVRFANVPKIFYSYL